MTRRRAMHSVVAGLMAFAAAVGMVACTASTPAHPLHTDTNNPDTQTHDAGSKSDAKAVEGDTAPTPEADAVSPSQAIVGSVGPTVTITGKNFVPRSVVQLDGTPLATAFASPTELHATIPNASVAQVHAAKLWVVTAEPGGGKSAELPFQVVNASPVATTLLPASANAGSADTSLEVDGRGFVSGAKVVFGTADLPTTFKSGTTLTATIPASQLKTAGSFPVKVVNPAPGGGESQTISFTVANPTVTLTSLSPASATIGSPKLTLDMVGSGFVAASKAVFNGTALTTRYVSATELSADVPAASLTTAGDFPVIVTNPAPGGGVSVPVIFSVGYAAPTLSSLSPSTAVAGSGPTTVTLTGTGFDTGSSVEVDGALVSSTYVNGTTIRATLTAYDLASPAAVAVRVVNPAPGGGTSNAQVFTITAPAPTISSVTPSTLTVGAPATVITVYGSNFTTSSIVTADGSPLTTTYVSSSELDATMPAYEMSSTGPISVRVATGSVTSDAKTVTVVPASSDDAGTSCDSTGVDVALDGVGTVKTASLYYSNGPAARFLYNPSDATSYTCPVTSLSSSTQNYAAIVVQNTTSSTQYLSAYADCISTDDAFMAMYPYTSTVPTSDSDREACSGYVANGSSGGGGYTSPLANGSTNCPGLTSANGGARVLGPCDKAVILVTPYGLSTETTPIEIKVLLEN